MAHPAKKTEPNPAPTVEAMVLLTDLAARLDVRAFTGRSPERLMHGIEHALERRIKGSEGTNDALVQATERFRDGFDSWARGTKLLEGGSGLSDRSGQSPDLARAALAQMIREVAKEVGGTSPSAMAGDGRGWFARLAAVGAVAIWTINAVRSAVSSLAEVAKVTAAVVIGSVAFLAEKGIGLVARLWGSRAKPSVTESLVSSTEDVPEHLHGDFAETTSAHARPDYGHITSRDPSVWGKMFVTEVVVIANGTGKISPATEFLGEEHQWTRIVPAIHTDESRASAPVIVRCRVEDLPVTPDRRLRIPSIPGMEVSAIAIDGHHSPEFKVRENVFETVELDEFISIEPTTTIEISYRDRNAKTFTEAFRIPEWSGASDVFSTGELARLNELKREPDPRTRVLGAAESLAREQPVYGEDPRINRILGIGAEHTASFMNGLLTYTCVWGATTLARRVEYVANREYLTVVKRGLVPREADGKFNGMGHRQTAAVRIGSNGAREEILVDATKCTAEQLTFVADASIPARVLSDVQAAVSSDDPVRAFAAGARLREYFVRTGRPSLNDGHSLVDDRQSEPPPGPPSGIAPQREVPLGSPEPLPDPHAAERIPEHLKNQLYEMLISREVEPHLPPEVLAYLKDETNPAKLREDLGIEVIQKIDLLRADGRPYAAVVNELGDTALDWKEGSRERNVIGSALAWRAMEARPFDYSARASDFKQLVLRSMGFTTNSSTLAGIYHRLSAAPQSDGSMMALCDQLALDAWTGHLEGAPRITALSLITRDNSAVFKNNTIIGIPVPPLLYQRVEEFVFPNGHVRPDYGAKVTAELVAAIDSRREFLVGAILTSNIAKSIGLDFAPHQERLDAIFSNRAESARWNWEHGPAFAVSAWLTARANPAHSVIPLCKALEQHGYDPSVIRDLQKPIDENQLFESFTGYLEKALFAIGGGNNHFLGVTNLRLDPIAVILASRGVERALPQARLIGLHVQCLRLMAEAEGPNSQYAELVAIRALNPARFDAVVARVIRENEFDTNRLALSKELDRGPCGTRVLELRSVGKLAMAEAYIHISNSLHEIVSDDERASVIEAWNRRIRYAERNLGELKLEHAATSETLGARIRQIYHGVEKDSSRWIFEGTVLERLSPAEQYLALKGAALPRPHGGSHYSSSDGNRLSPRQVALVQAERMTTHNVDRLFKELPEGPYPRALIREHVLSAVDRAVDPIRGRPRFNQFISAVKGFSLPSTSGGEFREFADYDPLGARGKLDTKATARYDRPLVKLREEPEQAPIRIEVTARWLSEGWKDPGQKPPHVTKLFLALVAASRESAPIELRIFGHGTTSLFIGSKELKALFKETPGVTDTLDLVVNRDDARSSLGLTGDESPSFKLAAELWLRAIGTARFDNFGRIEITDVAAVYDDGGEMQIPRSGAVVVGATEEEWKRFAGPLGSLGRKVEVGRIE